MGANPKRIRGMYTTITRAALPVVFLALIIQTTRREQSQDRLFYAVLGGSISAAMILAPSFFLPTQDSHENLPHCSFPSVY